VTLRRRLRTWCIRQHSRLSTATITKSAEMEAALPKRMRLRNSIVPNGVDIDLFQPVDRDRARATLGWPRDGRVALYVADPAELRKRYALTIAGVRRANAVLGNVRLVVAHRVPADLMPLYMNAADCLVLLSRMEGSPNVVKEALMCNLPIVATAVGDIPELLDAVEPSFLVEPTVDSVSSTLVKCLRQPTRSNGRSRSARLSAQVVAERVLAVYAAVLPLRKPIPSES
jgi:teichuronic acid biosynthesis glycosyltransferase TuaC